MVTMDSVPHFVSDNSDYEEYLFFIFLYIYCNRWFVFEFRQVLLDDNKYTDCVNLLGKEHVVLNEGQKL
jgi:hypothetical protein